MSSFVSGKWKCVSRFPEIMKKSLAVLENLTNDDAFKVKEDRIVFRFRIDEKWYFAKKNIPKELKEVLKELFRPQARIEYNVGVLLEKLGIPVVNMIGWGYNGTVSIIVSESPGEHVSTAMDFWSKIALLDCDKKNDFLIALATFIKMFASLKLIHSDLHLGNLLVVRECNALKLVIVDPFEIKRYCWRKYNIFKGGFALLLYGLQWDLSRDEKISLLLESHLINTASEFCDFWREVIENAVRCQVKEWPGGRERKFLTKSTRITQKIEAPNGDIFFIKRSKDGKRLLPKELLEDVNLVKDEINEGKSKWLFSLYLQSLGIDHVRVIAWKKAADGQDILFFENEKSFLPYTENSEYIRDFLQICQAAGIRVKNPSKDILFRGKIPCLKNCDPDYWH